MNQDQYHLCKIAEECTEVAQRALKAQQFGLEETQPGQDLNNLERLVLEFHDLTVTFDNFANMAMSEFDCLPSIEARRARLTKMQKFLELSKSLDQVDEGTRL